MAKPEIILLQCGADSLADDPITHLRLSEKAHAQAALSLCRIAETFCEIGVANDIFLAGFK